MAVHWKEIERLVKAHRMVDPNASEEDLRRALQVWWALKYSRPFKDPLLAEYTLNDLCYEYLTHHFLKPENDPRKQIEESKEIDDEALWIKKMLEEMKAQQAKKVPDQTEKPKEVENPGVISAPGPELPDLSTRFDE